MVSMNNYHQLEIHWVDLEPTKGAETQKERPCVILQSDIVNNRSKTFIIAPLLAEHKDWPFVVNINPSQKNGLDKPRHINLKQLRVVDISRIDNQQGVLEKEYLQSIHIAIRVVLGL